MTALEALARLESKLEAVAPVITRERRVSLVVKKTSAWIELDGKAVVGIVGALDFDRLLETFFASDAVRRSFIAASHA